MIVIHDEERLFAETGGFLPRYASVHLLSTFDDNPICWTVYDITPTAYAGSYEDEEVTCTICREVIDQINQSIVEFRLSHEENK